MIERYLRDYINKGLTVDELYQIIQQEQDESISKQLSIEEKRTEFVNSLFKQKYFKLVHNSNSTSYVELVKSDPNDWTVINVKEVKIHDSVDYSYLTSNKSGLARANVLWFNPPKEIYTGQVSDIATPIDAKDYLEIEQYVQAKAKRFL